MASSCRRKPVPASMPSPFSMGEKNEHFRPNLEARSRDEQKQDSAVDVGLIGKSVQLSALLLQIHTKLIRFSYWKASSSVHFYFKLFSSQSSLRPPRIFISGVPAMPIPISEPEPATQKVLFAPKEASPQQKLQNARTEHVKGSLGITYS